jgi:hypothetical protein
MAMSLGTAAASSFHEVEVHVPAYVEAHAPVQFNSPVIIVPHMQEGRAALRPDQFSLVLHQRIAIAFPQVVGVGADGAYFGVVVHVEALAGHGYELAACKDAVVVAERDRSLAERARPGEGGELHHLFDVLIVERNGLHGNRLWTVFISQYHLQSPRFMQQLPSARRADILGCGVKDQPARGQHVVKNGETVSSKYRAFPVPEARCRSPEMRA